MLADLTIWLNHFEYHALHPRRVPDELSDALTVEERRLIASSIARFQLGEQSEGTTLRAAARRFAHSGGRPELERITELFIREEQRHAALLREFMIDHAIPVKRRDWSAVAFTGLRRLGGFEFRLYVLLVAELIGNVYYRALEVATGCQRLKVLCRTLVADELAHVGFESQLMLSLRAQKPATAQWLIRLTHRCFFTCVALVVWLTHRRVLRHVGYDLSGFLAACRAQYSFYLAWPAHAKTSSSPLH